ncbi:MAG: cysteine-rich secretory protein family protein [Sporomusa sp.]|nr:cysteine-rich secretory protein family protein [Sporomusa sp.]
MKKFRIVTAAILTTLFVSTATVPALAAPTLYYSSARQLQAYQQYNKMLISRGYTPYNLVQAPATQPKPAPTPQPTPTPTPAPAPAPQPSTSTDALLTAPITAQEQQMVNLVNQERTSRGLNALSVDMRLVKVARMKSMDMIKNNYFGHQSPVYGSPFDLLKSQGITYRAAGENLAGNSSVSAAHTSLMNSTGHRANILNTSFTKIGIGIIQGGPYGLMISQEFIG